MSWVRKITAGLIFVVVFTAAVLFCVRNAQTVSLDFIFVQTPELSLSLVVIASFLLGGLLGLVMASASTMRERFKGASSSRRLQRTEQELQKLKKDSRSHA